MAIAFDTASTGNNAGGSASYSLSHTCNGPNALLVIGISADPTSDIVTSVKYNSVNCTLIDKISSFSVSGGRWSYLYFILGQTGTNNIDVVASTGGYLFVLGASYTGVKQTAQPDNHDATVTGSQVASYTSSLTSSAANCWVMLLSSMYNGNAADPGAGTGSTRRCKDNSFGVNGLFDSNGSVTGSYSMTTTRTPSMYFQHLMASFAPDTGGAPSGNLFRKSNLAGIGAGGPFFQDPLGFSRRNHIYVPRHLA
jgi:hypothetical protein